MLLRAPLVRNAHSLDDAIQFALENGNVDPNRVFLVGFSGGGYAALGAYLRSRHDFNSVYTWAPISDLREFFNQSTLSKLPYANHVLACTNSTLGDMNHDELRARSPIHFEVEKKPDAQLHIFAGINDGYVGTVSLSHSIKFFNFLAERFGFQTSKIPPHDAVDLLSRNIDVFSTAKQIGGKKVLYERANDLARLTIFDGEHEVLWTHQAKLLRDAR